ncbi:uncharacterized protein LOC106071200 isoform X1 [Biomphalaria glabrata]|uniref:Uncharacterized protein LOC106071200 isoform X1 n=1 Tax=Biomphalaria glabrata TaxID=6526 RepID=A0A9W2Z039_BIOGL|nr:uncharacterized protein LOC106071200 isoform X1 [Biomphalaria glabrata]XP_055868319.1 uncharacterized protein LOC106071200 isoform X1 [Biomphalaria glabrata]XP_055868320.1 uncharacterized protein LOC106071200 isoform X1 [Biomphalaria glabrata]
MDIFDRDDLSDLNMALSDRLSVNSDVSSNFSGGSSGGAGLHYSRVHTSFVDYSGESTPRGNLSDVRQYPYTDKTFGGIVRAPGYAETSELGHSGLTSPRWTRGFQGRPAIKSSRVSKRPPQTAWPGDSENLNSWPSQKAKTLDSRLLLTGNGIPRSSSSQASGERHYNVMPRSKTKLTLDRLKTNTSPEMSKTSIKHGKHCEACAVDYIKHYMKNPSVSEQNRRTTSIISEILDHPRPRAAIKAFYEPLQLLPKSKGQYEKNLMLAELTKEGPLNDFKLSKEPANLHTVCLPKKGLIKLTSMAYELNSPDYYDDRQKTASQKEQSKYREAFYGSALPPPSSDAFRGQLIRNKSIIRQIQKGEKLMADLEALRDGHEMTDGDLWDTLVGGILSYEIPEAPHLNTTLQKFIGGESLRNSPRHQRDQVKFDSLVRGTDRLQRSSPPADQPSKRILSPSFPALTIKE